MLAKISHETPSHVWSSLVAAAATALRPGGVVAYVDVNALQILKNNPVSNLANRCGSRCVSGWCCVCVSGSRCVSGWCCVCVSGWCCVCVSGWCCLYVWCMCEWLVLRMCGVYLVTGLCCVLCAVSYVLWAICSSGRHSTALRHRQTQHSALSQR